MSDMSDKFTFSLVNTKYQIIEGRKVPNRQIRTDYLVWNIEQYRNVKFLQVHIYKVCQPIISQEKIFLIQIISFRSTLLVKMYKSSIGRNPYFTIKIWP